ncbi:helix-turn-helix domain-containing protein [Streptomyces sp. NEAU-NA10]|uniref:helix-turn-helix domain-containing protein n=1 Tax=Streptomyces sp. NEAU-NA10 TaxID=3416050 RepID=UPI003CC6442B
MAHPAMPHWAQRLLARLNPRSPQRGHRPAAPLWVRGLTAGGRPIVLGVALLMCAPGEYHLARNAGWRDPFTYGMPVVLSAYAGIAAAVASTRRPGDRGRWSAIIGACLALGLAMAAQVVSHLIDTNHLEADQPLLIAVTSLVPPAVVGHLLHLAASPPAAQDTHASRAVPQASGVPLAPATSSAAAPTVTLERFDDQDTAETLALPPARPRLVRPRPGLRRPSGRGLHPRTRQRAGRPHSGGTAPRLVGSSEAAKILGIEPSTVRSWVAAGRLVPYGKNALGHNLFDASRLGQEVRA